MRHLLLPLILCLSPALPARAAVEFEAYYAVDIRGKPVGVTVQRNEVDPTTGATTISYLLKTTAADNDMEQFVSLKQDKSSRPLSYRFTSSVRKQNLRTEGRVRGLEIDLTLIGGKGQPERQVHPLTQDTFFSSALGPLLVRQKLANGQAYSFEAFSEEDGKPFDGEVLILDSAQVGKRRVYRTILRYQTLEQEAWFLDDGSTIATQSTSLPVKTYMIADPTQLLQDLEVPRTLLAKYFRAAPAGRENALARGEFSIPKEGLFKQKPDLDAFKTTKRIPLKLAN